MMKDDERNRKSWQETIWDIEAGLVEFSPRRRRTKAEIDADIRGPIDRSYVVLHEGNTHYGCENGTSKIYMHSCPRQRCMPIANAQTASKLEWMKKVAVKRQLKQFPALKDNRLVKLRLFGYDVKSKQNEVVTPDSTPLRVKITCDFQRHNTFEDVHEKGRMYGLFFDGNACERKDDPLLEVYRHVKRLEPQDIPMEEGFKEEVNASHYNSNENDEPPVVSDVEMIPAEDSQSIPKINIKFSGSPVAPRISHPMNDSQNTLAEVNGVNGVHASATNINNSIPQT